MFEKKESLAQRVAEMRKKGLSDNQILQSLQQEGHTSKEVLDAFEIADHSNTIQAKPVPAPVANPMQAQPQNIAPPAFNKPPVQNEPGRAPQQSDEEIEELIEAVIDEKWASIEKNINKVLEWKDSVEEQMADMKAKIKETETNFDSLHKAILGKVGDYDKNILNVGTQLKAMETVFSKVLPTFTENVSELSRIADNMKRKS